MTRQEYEAKLADLQSQIDELKKTEIEDDLPEPPHPRWKPEREKLYYTIDIGHARAESITWDGDDIDGDNYSLGFVFKTEAEAEFAAERLKVIAEMREWAGKWNNGIVLIYNSVDNSIDTVMTTGLYTNGEMRFATPEDAHNCVKAVGAERIKKYYFMISEEAHI